MNRVDSCFSFRSTPTTIFSGETIGKGESGMMVFELKEIP